MPVDSDSSPGTYHELFGETGELAGKSFKLTRDVLRIGRDPKNNDIVLQDPEISKKHLRIWLDASGKVQLEDLASTHGTFVNDVQVGRITLTDGVRIRLANPNNVLTYRARIRQRVQPNAGPGISEDKPPTPAGSSGPAAAVPTFAVPSQEEANAVRLQLVIDRWAVQEIPVTSETLIGSSEACTIVIQHDTVSAAHARLLLDRTGRSELFDLDSAHGTFVNGARIRKQELREGDVIRLGECDLRVLLFREARRPQVTVHSVQLEGPLVTIGRDAANTVRLDHPTVSRFHARIRRNGDVFEILDGGSPGPPSTNGTFVNGARVTEQRLRPNDTVMIGAVELVFDGRQFKQQAARSGIRIHAHDLERSVADQKTGAPRKILQGVSLAVEPREFVGLLGPSGCGKSTLINALNGSQGPDSGLVLLNHHDLYREFASLRALIGVVPQDDILHRVLTVRECLDYSARLRLPVDYSPREIRQRVDEVLETLNLAERADAVIQSLSGGQRKRVSVGIELLSNPSVLYLDEPTAGQDPRTELEMMQTFRHIANRGATVLITTHLLGCFSLLDKAAVMVRGRLAYFGPSHQMLPYFKVKHPEEVYELLERQKSPDRWAAEFRGSRWFEEGVREPLRAFRDGEEKTPAARSSLASAQRSARRLVRGGLRELHTLASRQFALKIRGWADVLTLLLPPAAVGGLVGMMRGDPNQTKVLFIIVFSALWFGCSAAVREITDEDAVYRRERQRGVTIPNYLASKLLYLSTVAVVQSLLFIGILAATDRIARHFLEMSVIAWALLVEGGLIGLLISAVAPSAERALIVFPVSLIPQLLLAGLFIPVSVPFQSYPAAGLVELWDDPNTTKIKEGQAMSALLRHGLSPLMVSRWGFEALADICIHDAYVTTHAELAGRGYALALLNDVPITWHPDDAGEIRTHARALMKQRFESVPVPASAASPALAEYGLALASFAAAMTALIALALKRKDAQ